MNPPVVLSVRIRGDAEGPQTGDVVLEGASISQFTQNKEYETGDVFVYNNQLYQALEDFTAGGEPDFDIIQQIGIPDIILENFATNTEYKKYQFVAYNGQIYRAKADFISGSSWVSSKWEKLGDVTYTFKNTDGTVTITKTDDGYTLDFSVQNALDDLEQDIDTKLYTKVDKEDGKGLSSLDYTQTDKDKLDNLINFKVVGKNLTYNASTGELSANDPAEAVYDSALDSTSENAVQNKAITAEFDNRDAQLTSLKTRVSTAETNIQANADDIDDLEDDISDITSDISDLTDALDDKVDKEAGKGLSTNDFDNDWVTALTLYKNYNLVANYDASTQTVSLIWEAKS